MRPIICTGNGDYAIQGLQGWKPLYNLHHIVARTEAVVYVFEGEKTADAGVVLFPDGVATTFMGGVNGVHYVETYALEGRDVVLWPDNDVPGEAAMMAMAGYALKSGAKSVRKVVIPEGFPEKWDVADPWPEEWVGKLSYADLIEQAVPITLAEAKPYMRDRKAAALQRRLLGHQGKASKVDPAQVKAALGKLYPDMSKAEWTKIAGAIYYAYGAAGLPMFDEWSKRGDKYKQGEPAALWERFGKEKRFQAASLRWLFRCARDAAAADKDTKFAVDDAALAMAAVEELNRDHAVVTRGSKTVVMWEYFDPVRERFVQTYLQKADFVARHVNHVTLPDEDEQKTGKKCSMQLGQYWFNSVWRNRKDAILFSPDKKLPGNMLNTWTGFTVDPVDKPDGWAKFKRHLFDNVAGGDQAAFDYLLDWMAFAVQRLDGKPGTAIVLIGPKGAGKSIVIKIFGALFGPHCFVTAHDEDIVGRFNPKLEDTLLMGLEEAVAPQSRKADSIIKDLITRDELRLEDKFFSPWSAPNHLRIMMTSNNDHVVRADGYERRYAVYDVRNPFGDDADTRRRYFEAIVSEMENGGQAAMLGELQLRDISRWNPEKLPRTEALRRQKEYSVGQDPVQAWYYDTLSDGLSITRYKMFGGPGAQWDMEKQVLVRTRDVLEDFEAYCKQHGKPYSERKFTLGLPKLMPPGFKAEVVRETGRSEPGDDYKPAQYKAYPFPPLNEARAAFTAKTGLAFEQE